MRYPLKLWPRLMGMIYATSGFLASSFTALSGTLPGGTSMCSTPERMSCMGLPLAPTTASAAASSSRLAVGSSASSTRQRHALRLPARKLRWLALRQVVHAQRLQRGADGGGVFRLACSPLRHRQVLLHGQRRAQVQFLRQEANSLRPLSVRRYRFKIIQRLPGHVHRTRRRCHQPRHQREPSRLATARGAAEHQHGALRHIHVGELPRQVRPRVAIAQTSCANHASAPVGVFGTAAPEAQSTHTPRTAKSMLMPL